MHFNQTNHNHSLTRRGVLTLGLLSTLLLLLLLGLNSAQPAAAKPLGQGDCPSRPGDCPISPTDKAALIALYDSIGLPLPEEINLDYCNEWSVVGWCAFIESEEVWRVKQLEISFLTVTDNYSGTLPSALGNLSELEELRIRTYGDQSKITGPIPSSLGNLHKLELLFLDGNNFEGSIPASLGNLKKLRKLSLKDNQLSGSIPGTLGGLSELELLHMRGNQFSSAIPASFGELESLIDLDLRYSGVSGSIPPELGNLNNLLGLDLHGNNLTGPIPSELGQLINLSQLYLSDNPLAGELPLSLTNLINLNVFHFTFTCLTEPQDQAFQDWLNGIGTLARNWSPHPSCSMTIASCVDGKYFLDVPLPVHNRFDATVDWDNLGSAAGFVEFNLGGQKTTPSLTQGVYPEHYNMSADLIHLFPSASNNLQIRALAPDGSELASQDIKLIGIDVPPFLPLPVDVSQTSDCSVPGSKNDVKYSTTYKFPPDDYEPLFIEAPFLPQWIPFLANKSLVVLEAIRPEFKMTAKPSGQGTLQIASSPFPKDTLTIAGKEVGLKLLAEGKVVLSEANGITLEGAGFGLNAEVDVFKPKKWKAVELICKRGGVPAACILVVAEELPVLGKAVAWFNNNATVEATLKAGIGGLYKYKVVNDSLEWENSELTGSLAAETVAKLSIFDLITAKTFGGGTPGFTLQAPPNPDTFKEAFVKLKYGVGFSTIGYERNYEEVHQWKWPETTTTAAPDDLHTMGSDSGWQPMARPYLDGPAPYANFVANTIATQAGSNETAVVTNVFADGYPAVAAGDSQTVLLWVHDDVNKPTLQAKEIYFSVYDGATWSTPAGITADTLQDFNPHVALDQNGQAVALWQRNKNQQAADAELNAAYTNGFEIATSVWNGNAWSQPVLLTDDNAFDLAPALVRGNDGQLVAVWRKNSAGELLSDNANPDQLMFALWDGSSWSQPAAIFNSVVGILGLAPARHNDNTMSIVYSQDMDGDYGTSEDQELFQTTWNGSSWGSPVRLTNDNVPDNSPSLFYTGDGQLQLVWVKGESLYGLIGDLSGTPVEIIGDGSGTLLDYAAVQTPDDNLAMFWQASSEAGGDIYYAVYNAEHNAFSDIRQLTDDESLEAFMAPSIAPNGEVVVAYNETALVKEDVEIAPGEMIQGVTTFGQTDLYVLRDTLDFVNLAGGSDVFLPVIIK